MHRTSRLTTWRAAVLSSLLAVTCIGSVGAQEQKPRLRVGTKVIAPFAFRGAEGRWRGMSIDLWRRIATRLGVEFDFVELPLGELIEGLEKKDLDAVVAALTVTPEREAKIDFTHSIYPSGLGIAVPASSTGGFQPALRALVSWRFLQGVGALVLLILLVGIVVWWFERRRNPEQFGGSAARGIGAGFWWSAVTMTTVGYGDKVPISIAGRIVGLVWMFAAIITISGFTAAIASSLTLSQLESSIQGPEDLTHVGRVVTVDQSTSDRYLQAARIQASAVADPGTALAMLADGGAEAVVYDAPILRYEVRKRFQNKVQVLPLTFERQDYAIGLPLDSPLRKAINRALLAELREPTWQDVLFKYLGRE